MSHSCSVSILVSCTYLVHHNLLLTTWLLSPYTVPVPCLIRSNLTILKLLLDICCTNIATVPIAEMGCLDLTLETIEIYTKEKSNNRICKNQVSTFVLLRSTCCQQRKPDDGYWLYGPYVCIELAF
jgi:hypothetical protein